MRILVVGSGGREHAIAWKLAQFGSDGRKIFVAPGNAGTAQCAQNVPIKALDTQGLLGFAKQNKIDLTIVGPEGPLECGIVDQFFEAGQRIFGPTGKAAELESRKTYTKVVMEQVGVPTAPFRNFRSTAFTGALNYVKQAGLPIVIKQGWPSQGKGVTVCRSFEEAEKTLASIRDRPAHMSGDRIVIEKYMQGQEVSLHVFCDGQNILPVPFGVHDYKQLLDGNLGPNTGGIGAFGPVPEFGDAALHKAIDITVTPILDAARARGREFRGACLYPGLMMTDTGPVVLEYNVRLGDPETQVIARLLASDPLEIFEACINGTLADCRPIWSSDYAACVVLCSDGYPGVSMVGYLIDGLQAAQALPGVEVFHSGTLEQKGEIWTDGGRVLSITAVGATHREAIERCYEAANMITFQGKYCRSDIGCEFI